MNLVARCIHCLTLVVDKVLIRQLIVLLLGFAYWSAVHAATPAGTVIRNQALATYTDTDGNRVSVASNLVETMVEQVAGLELSSDQQQRVVDGTEFTFSHRLINTGNADDSYSLLLSNAGGSINVNDLSIYSDVNRDGVADSTIPLSVTPVIVPGGDYFLVVRGAVPLSTIDGDSALVLLTATSAFESAITISNTDTITVGNGPAITVRKSISQRSGLSPSGTYQITLEYENTGDEAAGNVVIIDALPSGMSYVAGSARWSETINILTDDDPADVQSGLIGGIRYCAYDATCTGLPKATQDGDSDSVSQVSAIIDLVNPGVLGSVRFSVQIAGGLSAGYIQNTAEYEYDIAIATISRQYSNTVSFEVLASAGVIANGSTATPINGLSEPVSIVSVGQGGSVRFDNIIWNTGNSIDTFNIEVDSSGSTYPVGTIWQLLRDGGNALLTDTNNDGLVDTGPILPEGFARIVLQLDLPEGVSGNNAGLGFDLQKSARSVTDAAVFDSVTDHLDEIVGNLVDLTNFAAAGTTGALGVGPGPEATAVTTVSPNELNVAVFDLFIRHQGSEPDSYRLRAFSSIDGEALPANWILSFIDPDSGVSITSTGLLASGMSKHVEAHIKLPIAYPSGTVGVWFDALSDLSGASDRKHDAITIAAQSSLSLEPSLSAQLEPGGTFVYEHKLVNNGNASVSGVALTVIESRPDWVSVVYLDTNGDGALDAGDLIYSVPLTLASAESRNVFVKVFAPASASVLQRNTTTLTAIWNANTQSVLVQDQSIVNQSRVMILKEQAIDTGCNGLPDTGSSFGVGQIEVAPGDNCVIYRLTAINQGIEPSYNVKIHDYTPPYTSYQTAAQCSRTPCWTVEPAQGGVGAVNAETDQLLPGDSFYLQFIVRID